MPLLYTTKKIKKLCCVTFLIFITFYFGVFTHIFEVDFKEHFHYPYDGDIEEFVQQLRANVSPKVPPINSYDFEFTIPCSHKCKEIENIRLIFLIKSAPENWKKRMAIRNSWGFERRFSDVEIRTVFLIGERDDEKLQKGIEEESMRFADIVQAKFIDSYYNNTLKTMMGFSWIVKYCPKARFYMFVDDDYYISTKNLLRFIRDPTGYPTYLEAVDQRSLNQFDFDLDENVRLYTGYVFRSAPHRHRSSKWFVSLEEYPYDMWPPYVTAGAYVLSREAVIDMYYASFYTKHFRFDDIYVGLLAFKCQIEPYHSKQFYFNKLSSDADYKYAVAAHGYEDPIELVNIWMRQKSKGNA